MLGKREKIILKGAEMGLGYGSELEEAIDGLQGVGGGGSNQVWLTMVGLVNDKVQVIGVTITRRKVAFFDWSLRLFSSCWRHLRLKVCVNALDKS
jgi:hypothetical protein